MKRLMLLGASALIFATFVPKEADAQQGRRGVRGPGSGVVVGRGVRGPGYAYRGGYRRGRGGVRPSDWARSALACWAPRPPRTRTVATPTHAFASKKSMIPGGASSFRPCASAEALRVGTCGAGAHCAAF
jgi:hypothetical protein